MQDVYKLMDRVWLWPPFLGAGISVVSYERPLNNIVIKMPLLRRNTNYVGTHFGGSLYSMCDPWFMFILMEHLGSDYVVWDKSAEIDFVKPGTGVVTARFHIAESHITQIRERASTGEKVLPSFQTEVLDIDGKLIASLRKGLYVRKKRDS